MLTGKNALGSPIVINVDNTSVCFVGRTRCGKSTQISKLISESVNDTECINIIFDIKSDFVKRFYKPGDKILSLHNNGSISENWSLIRELLSSPNPDDAAAELAGSVFSEAVSHSSQPFFAKSARTIFETYLRLLVRKCPKAPPTNEQLINSVLSFDESRLINECKPYPELMGVNKLIMGAAATVGGIRAELNQALSDTFKGSFCSNGSFSICKYIRNNSCGTVYLVTSVNELQSSVNAFRIILDLAVKESLSGTAKAKKLCFFIDELPLLGRLEHLQTLLNFGAGYGASAIIGFQSVAQLVSAYDESDANAIISGLRTQIVFNANDNATGDYFSLRSGKELRTVTRMGNDRKPFITTAELPAVTTAELMRLNTGQAYCFASGEPARFIFFDE